MMRRRGANEPTINIYDSAAALTAAAADVIVLHASNAIRERGRFVIALSGGSTPRSLYSILATESYVSQIDWSVVHVCWGDERCVPPDRADSNYRMANDALLSHVPIPAANVHRMRGELEPSRAAEEYETELRSLLSTKEGEPTTIANQRIDLTLLGLGADGHTASLFPNGGAVQERTEWVAAEYGSSVKMWRLTMTPPLLNASANVLFLAAGSDKAATVQRVVDGPFSPTDTPAQIIAPSNGTLQWMLDRGAASQLNASRCIT